MANEIPYDYEEWLAMTGYVPEVTCTNSDMHAKFADRGIEDQCPYCLMSSDPGRVQDA